MKNSVRWLPAVIAPVLVVAGVIAIPAVASAAGTPPSKTAQQVLALVAHAKGISYSGTIQQSSDLGLPQLPKIGPGSSSTGTDATSQVLDLLTADHTARLFVDGSSKQRVQVLDQLAERDVIRNGTDVWAYDSKTRSATHLTLTEHDATPAPDAEAVSPAQLADRFITAIEPSTGVAVTSTSEVAGRAVYQLELTPKSTGTLVASVTLSVDAKTGLPLKVVVDARGQKADAFSVGFSSIDFSTPPASLFQFAPPAGTSVSTLDKPAPTAHGSAKDAVKPSVIGSGWDAIIALPAGAATAAAQPGAGSDSSQSALLDQLTTSVDGGRALQTSLLSVLLLNDGRVFVGAVPITSLEAAAK